MCPGVSISNSRIAVAKACAHHFKALGTLCDTRITRGLLNAWHASLCPTKPSVAAMGGIFALRAHCALLLDYVPPEEPPGTTLGKTLRIR